MKDLKMQYKDFVFPINPNVIEIVSKRNVEISSIYGAKSVTQNISQSPLVVKGSGMFYGDNAQEYCTYLEALLRKSDSGVLHAPGLYPINAYFTGFTYRINAEKGAIEYDFEFTQVFNSREEEINIGYTFALDGETAFDIADRMNMSVDEIMTLNEFKNPFDISEGDRVILQ